VAALGLAATFLVIGIAYAAVVGYGFFNPAFRGMDHVRPAAGTQAAEGR
jgi:hypothetical protein